MALFINQNESRTQLQSKIAADLQNRVTSQGGAANNDAEQATMLQESQAATGRSLFWAGVVAMIVIAVVVFMLFVFNGA